MPTSATRDGGSSSAHPRRLCLFGAAGDTGNLGVSALMYSAVGAVARFAPDAHVTVFDNGWGVRPAVARVGEREFAYDRCGARLSKRYHRPEAYANMRLAAKLGGLWNPGARALLAADAVWDVTGGDSFTDLYGERHLRAMMAPKELALELGRPLVLLPQTYGPFTTDASRTAAGDVIARAAMAWARDERSFETLKELVGPRFDPARHRVGVDMAFALERHEPRGPLAEPLASWLTDGARPTIGINVSGLLFNDPAAARKYSLTVDYAALARGLVRRFLDETDARIVMLPHVIPTDVPIESDVVAGDAIRAELGREGEERVVSLPPGYDPSETKWILSRLDWFTGARMHATIGAISSFVPTGGQAYSVKMQGVFETCGQGGAVADLRALDTSAALEALWRTWENRAEHRRVLEERVPGVAARALEQLREIVEAGR